MMGYAAVGDALSKDDKPHAVSISHTGMENGNNLKAPAANLNY